LLLLKTGHYQSQSEILREGLRLLQEREELKQLRLAQLRGEIATGSAEADRASSLTVGRPLLKSASGAPNGNVLRNETLRTHAECEAGRQRHLELYRL
jgi:putative addiction module CopG family antidote